jgi:hypothetical protein
MFFIIRGLGSGVNRGNGLSALKPAHLLLNIKNNKLTIVSNFEDSDISTIALVLPTNSILWVDR